MNILGIVAEYNPFHNGHLYHLNASIKLSKAQSTVCVMSGNFIQRGEPSIVNKWARTKMALKAGIDLVVELPVVYSMSSAEYFSRGAVKLLDSLGFVTHLCFGSEHGKIPQLEQIADILLDEPVLYRTRLKEHLSGGLSFPAAREAALKEYFKIKGLDPDIVNAINSSNNILGIEYIKALKSMGSSMNPLTIKRKSNDYNCRTLSGRISSATSIRKTIFEESVLDERIKYALPSFSIDILEDEFGKGRGPVSIKDFEKTILTLIRLSDTQSLKELSQVSEGLENRIKNAALECGKFECLLEEMTTKRYTNTRLQRILCGLLTGITTEEFDTFNKHGGPQYIRVLGFNQKGRELLSMAKKTAILPVIVKTANYKKSCNPLLKRMMEIELRATDAYVLAYDNPDFRRGRQDFLNELEIYHLHR